MPQGENKPFSLLFFLLFFVYYNAFYVVAGEGRVTTYVRDNGSFVMGRFVPFYSNKFLTTVQSTKNLTKP